MSGAVLDRTEQFTAPASASQVPYLRHQVAKTLADWGIVDRADDALSACAELVANALTYGQTEVLSVLVTEHDGWLRLTVPDHNPYPPYPTTADRDAEDGRGVFLLAALADAWGFRAFGTGKDVFAEFQFTAEV
jgi:anti-sigma regulatory factor (Ser/Thr protein kinase)